MSKYTVQLEDLRLKLAHRNNELGEMKSKVCKLELTLSVNHLPYRIFVISPQEDRMKEQLEVEKNNRISLLTEFNKLTALNDSLKSLDHGHKQRLQSMEIGESKLREESERHKRCEMCPVGWWCDLC